MDSCIKKQGPIAIFVGKLLPETFLCCHLWGDWHVALLTEAHKSASAGLPLPLQTHHV